MPAKKLRILFTGYAPVHFLCFEPLYRRLVSMLGGGVDVFVSGGIREEDNGVVLSYDLERMYSPLGVPREHMLTVHEIAEQDFDVLFSAHTNLIAPRSFGRSVQIFHGVSFRNRAVRAENMGCDQYFLAGPYMQRIFAAAGLMKEGDSRGVPIGFMKTDPLRDGSLNRESVLRSVGFSGARPIILYAPTGARFNSLETIGEGVLDQLLSTSKYDILVKLHDHPKDASRDWHTFLRGREGEHFRFALSMDVTPLLFIADLLITDASSVANEYALLDRPIVFLDVPELLAKFAVSGSAMDLDTWGRKTGPLVKEPREIVDAVAQCLREPDRFSDIRRAAAADLFFNPGRATDTAVEWLKETVRAAV